MEEKEEKSTAIDFLRLYVTKLIEGEDDSQRKELIMDIEGIGIGGEIRVCIFNDADYQIFWKKEDGCDRFDFTFDGCLPSSFWMKKDPDHEVIKYFIQNLGTILRDEFMEYYQF